MPTGDTYRIKAADIQAKARSEPNLELRAAFETLALGYLRLADQADRRERYDLPKPAHLEHPTPQQQQPQAPQQQQQQQQQPQKKR